MRTFSIVASSVALSSAQSNDGMAPVAPVTKDHSNLITVAAAGGGALATHLAINAAIDHKVLNFKDAIIDAGVDMSKELAESNLHEKELTADVVANELKESYKQIDDIAED